jgi:hypothetical protein
MSSISLPVIRPPRGVLTPDALFTAVRENDPASGKEHTNELMMLDKPNANNSCEASTALPFATTERKNHIIYIKLLCPMRFREMDINILVIA